jgi:lipopolysaccharide transport system ATP-binding protein
MSDDIVISVKNVSKAYRIWNDPGSRLKSPLISACGRLFPSDSVARRKLEAKAAAYYRDFYALKDISFQVRKGESVGIIGRNGSGKSTLLQIIAGTLQPTTGSVRVNGRVAALLELGSGFNPDFTGRENVYLNAAVLGLSRKQTDAKFAGIAAFADIGDFLDQPVKTYSSGMMMRLAFAVQTAVEPDILIVDEALSVGDAPFQAKCFARIHSLLDSGCSTLFVSHDIGTVRAFCKQAIWLSAGIAAAQGACNEVCGAYQNDCLRAMGMSLAETPVKETAEPTGSALSPANELLENSVQSILSQPRAEYEKSADLYRKGCQRVRIDNFFFLDAKGNRSSVLHWDEPVAAIFTLGSTAGYGGHFQISINLRTIQGVQLLSCSNLSHGLRLSIPPAGNAIVQLRTRLPLRAGKYIVYAGIHLFPEDGRFATGTYDFTRAEASDLVGHAAYIEIAPQFNLGIYGPVQMESVVTVASPPAFGAAPVAA